MKDFYKVLEKYIILLLIQSLFGMPWFYLRFILFDSFSQESILNYIPTIAEYIVKITVMILLFMDFKKYDLKLKYLSIISVLFAPLFGIVIFSLLLIEKNSKVNKIRE